MAKKIGSGFSFVSIIFNPLGKTWFVNSLLFTIIVFLFISGNFDIISGFNFDFNSLIDDSYKKFCLKISGFIPISMK
jgi:hypothetical protein